MNDSVRLSTQDPREPHAGFAMMHGAPREQLCQAVRQLDAAEQRRNPIEMSQALAQVGRCFRTMSAFTQAESYLRQALRQARLISTVDTAAELLAELAELSCSAAEALVAQDASDNLRAHGARERARDAAFEAANLAMQVSDPQWEVKLLLRVSDVLNRLGDHDDAVSMQSRALTLLHVDAAPADTHDPLRNAAPNRLM